MIEIDVFGFCTETRESHLFNSTKSPRRNLEKLRIETTTGSRVNDGGLRRQRRRLLGSWTHEDTYVPTDFLRMLIPHTLSSAFPVTLM